MRNIIPMFLFGSALVIEIAIVCAAASAEEASIPDVTYEAYENISRWVDSRYNVVCYAFSKDTLRCFPISDEGTVQYSLDFQNQTD